MFSISFHWVNESEILNAFRLRVLLLGQWTPLLKSFIISMNPFIMLMVAFIDSMNIFVCNPLLCQLPFQRINKIMNPWIFVWTVLFFTEHNKSQFRFLYTWSHCAQLLNLFNTTAALKCDPLLSSAVYCCITKIYMYVRVCVCSTQTLLSMTASS